MRQRSAMALLVVATGFFVVACDDDPVEPTTGSITVNTTSSGAEIDADGYTISVDGSGATAIDATGSVTIENVTPGARSVMLDGVAGNCSVDTNPAAATVTAGETATVDFAVTCAATMGAVKVTTSTTEESGFTPDDDGYMVAVGTDTVTTAVNDTVVVEGVPLGDVLLELLDVEGSCAAAPLGSDTATVTVAFPDTVSHVFSVRCSPS